VRLFLGSLLIATAAVPGAQAAQPLDWWLAWDAALAQRIVAAGTLRLEATEAVATLEQVALPAAGQANLAADATDVALAAPTATALVAGATVRQRNARPAVAVAAAAAGAAFADAGGVVLSANEAAGAATLQANAVAIHIGLSSDTARAVARTALDQRIDGASVVAGGYTATAVMSGIIAGRVGVVAANQSAGTLGNQANVISIAQPAVVR
jgi:hypothetical protein